MDEAAHGRGGDQAEEPQDEEDDGDRVEHGGFALASFLGGRRQPASIREPDLFDTAQSAIGSWSAGGLWLGYGEDGAIMQRPAYPICAIPRIGRSARPGEPWVRYRTDFPAARVNANIGRNRGSTGASQGPQVKSNAHRS